LAYEFTFAGLVPAPNNVVLGSQIEAMFTARYGEDAAETYWRAWKGNWGFRLVVHTWGNTDNVRYPAPGAYGPTLLLIAPPDPYPDPLPHCCNCALCGGHCGT